jgi:Na+-transporting NADH:ubiquinone oxidoreductase subunit C
MIGDKFFGKRIFPILFMLIITIVCIAIVSSIYLSTKDRVKRNESLFFKIAVLFAADIAVPEEPEEVENIYNSRIESVNGELENAEYFRILSPDGEFVGYVLPAEGPGLWGEIEAVIGFERDRETLTGVEFTKQNETPGLGARITEEWYREQFRGKRGPFVLTPEGTAEGVNEIDAITGASRTSDFVQQIMNRAAQRVKELGTS